MGSIVLSELGRHREVSIEYDGREIKLQIVPSAVNDYWIEALQGLESNDRQGYMKLLTEVVAGWNLVDDEEQPLAVSVDILRVLPIDLLYQFAWEIFEAMTPKAKTGAQSAGG